MESYLNIAAGKIYPIDFEKDKLNFLVQLDTMYWHAAAPQHIEENHKLWHNKKSSRIMHCKTDAFEFLGLYKYQFEHISCYRFLEHIPKPEIQGFIYLLSTALKIGGTLDIIVPNYEILANMILEENITEDMEHAKWEKHDTLLTYELLNEPSMPHASIWTPTRIYYFFNLEERFKVTSMEPNYEFDGRNCYIRAKLVRIK
jgi:predicted SAM-dependent methyltransferase